MFTATRSHDLTGGRLLRPLGEQAVIGFPVVSQVACRLQQEITVHNPEVAIHRWSDLEDEPSIFDLSRLLNIARTCNQEFPSLARKAPSHTPKWPPLFPELPRLIGQDVWMLQHFLNNLEGLTLLRKTNQIPQWFIVRGFSMRQVQGVTGFVPQRREIERRTQFCRHEKRHVRVGVNHDDRGRAGTQLEGKTRPNMYARSRNY